MKMRGILPLPRGFHLKARAPVAICAIDLRCLFTAMITSSITREVVSKSCAVHINQYYTTVPCVEQSGAWHKKSTWPVTRDTGGRLCCIQARPGCSPAAAAPRYDGHLPALRAVSMGRHPPSPRPPRGCFDRAERRVLASVAAQNRPRTAARVLPTTAEPIV
jgi:hypothetical protein